MKSKFYIAAAVCLLLGACGGCNKEDCPDVYTETPPELAAWFVFPEGSWWAYENDKNDRIDTLRYYTSLNSTYTSGRYDDDCVYGIKYSAQYSLMRGKSFFVTISCGDTDSICSLNIEERWPGISENNKLYAYFSYNPNGNSFEKSIPRTSIEEKEQLNNYENVLTIEDDQFLGPFVFSKHVGLISFSVNDTSFSLLNYSIK